MALVLHSLPDKEIEDIFNLQHTLSQGELSTLFETIIENISRSLESIHLSVFTLEQNVKVDEYHIQDLNPLGDAMRRIEPLIISLSDLNEIMLNKGINKGQQITKIQSEWSSLQHFLTSVKKQVMISHDEKELIRTVESLLLKMDDVSTMIFDFQERKQHMSFYQQHSPTSSSSEAYSESTTTTATNDLFLDTESIASSTVTGNKWSQQNSKDDQLMMDIDAAYEPLLQSIEHIYHRITSLQVPNPLLNRRFEKVKEKWELLQYERDELKFEHKEDRWLAVFRRVADQVDVMIDGLDRSVVQCYSIIQQAKDYQLQQQQQQHLSSMNVFDKFSKSFLRTFHHNHTPSTTTSSTKTNLQRVDKEKFRSIEKSFEAKYKYYTPSIDRMLAMLGNGISARVSRDNQTSQRHESMLQRWHHLKEVMDELRMRDLIETERIIHSNSTSTSSIESGSRNNSNSSSNAWKGIRYKTPEPKSYDERQRSTTPNQSNRNSIGRSSPRSNGQSLLRGSISDSSSVGSSPSSNRQTKTPRPTRNGSTTTTNKKIVEDFYDEDERHYGVDLMKLNHTRRPPSVNSNANHYIRSNSTLERKRSQDRPFTSTRSKTPNPPSSLNRKSSTSHLTNPTIRSKSSMGDLMTPSRHHMRSTTPSLIPRPKTPKEERAVSPMIPRPRSQLKHNTNSNKPPPVPPIPKYVISHQNDYAAYRDPLLVRKKQSMTSLRHSNNINNNNTNSNTTTTMEISFHDECIYHPDPKDPLDVEVGQIINASPISIKCSRAQPGRYYFGNELSMSSMGGKKMYTCKLMTYGDRRGGQFKNNKVLIRVGGGWQDLEFFLLEHSSLMASDVVVRSFGSK